MKHNNQIPNGHFHKDWQRYVKTWFDQPAGKVRRRAARTEKAKACAPRPLNKLRPIVRPPTIKYNNRIRAGRGFTVDEIKAAGFNKHSAQGLGIAIDYRRRNRSEEAFQVNVQRLKIYKSKLVVFPRNNTSKRAKKGDSSEKAKKTATQTNNKHVLDIRVNVPRVKARAISKDEKSKTVTAIARKARTDCKLWGARERRAAVKADAEKAAALKKKK